ncbi:hypothetical protein QE152_g30961 [Popillia japonica]|uniref:Uncharacterized protein n=1 Tax=Popillia japonica TaxID=7064 RepID=A0AAW1JCW2_POPJA
MVGRWKGTRRWGEDRRVETRATVVSTRAKGDADGGNWRARTRRGSPPSSLLAPRATRTGGIGARGRAGGHPIEESGGQVTDSSTFLRLASDVEASVVPLRISVRY